MKEIFNNIFFCRFGSGLLECFVILLWCRREEISEHGFQDIFLLILIFKYHKQDISFPRLIIFNKRRDSWCFAIFGRLYLKERCHQSNSSLTKMWKHHDMNATLVAIIFVTWHGKSVDKKSSNHKVDMSAFMASCKWQNNLSRWPYSRVTTWL